MSNELNSVFLKDSNPTLKLINLITFVESEKQKLFPINDAPLQKFYETHQLKNFKVIQEWYKTNRDSEANHFSLERSSKK